VIFGLKTRACWYAHQVWYYTVSLNTPNGRSIITFRTKHDDLRNNDLVMRWYRNLQQGARITGDVYLRTLGLYCKSNATNPEQILEDAGTGKLKNDFMDFVYKQGNDGKAGSYVMRFKKVITSWVAFNDIDANLKGVKIIGSNISPTLTDERPPLKDEIDEMLRSASVRGRVIISLLAFSGLRPETLGNYDGSDALRIKDIEGLKIGNEGVEFTTFPAMLKVRQTKVQLSKKGHGYFTFIPAQAGKYLKDYLDQRIREGETVSPESPIITTDTRGSNKRRTGILATVFILKDARSSIRNAGLKFRPYALRVYWASCMDVAEAKGIVSHNWREFWMGHTGDISARYSTNKVLPDDTKKAMRETYRRCEPLLVTETKEVTQEDVKKGFRIEFLSSVLGYAQDKIDQLDLDNMSNEDFQNLVKKGILGNITGNGTRQKIVTEREIERYMNEGYEVFTTLPSGKIIMKLPS
jgi:integrase